MKDDSIPPGASLLLDLLRILSSAAVVFGHGMSFFGVLPRFHPPRMPWIQEIAVVVFFWLSGFLIAASLARTSARGHGLREYLLARGSRVLVPLWGALVFTAVIDAVVSQGSHATNRGLNEFVGNALMLQGVPGFGIEPFGSNRPLWTVALEWWIYLFVGCLMLSKKRVPLPVLPGLAIAVLILAFNVVGGRGEGLFFVWVFGALSWHSCRALIQRQPKSILLMLTLGFLIAACARWLKTGVAYDLVAATSLACCLLGAVALSTDMHVPFHVQRLVAACAAPSYSLYLVHYPILLAVGKSTDKSGSQFASYVILALVAAVVSWALLERPRHHFVAFAQARFSS